MWLREEGDSSVRRGMAVIRRCDLIVREEKTGGSHDWCRRVYMKEDF
jgi:hypothetical protein